MTDPNNQNNSENSESGDSDAEVNNSATWTANTRPKPIIHKDPHRRLSLYSMGTNGKINQKAIGPIIDDSFEPKILRKNNSIVRTESRGSLVKESKVLVIYTGGTIGMVKNHKGVYEPCASAFCQSLKKYPQLHDQEYFNRYFNTPEHADLLVLPETNEKSRILYTVYEYDPLLDSSNMTIDDWVLIAQNIKREYHRFDGFVILHGTDTMAYTASALSFMLENLGKTVVISGSQIPLFEARSDGKENLLNSLIIAGNYCIPEVTILFNNKLFRGNRTSKVSASALDAFDSPNMSPLVNIGIKINVDWSNVFRPSAIAKIHVHSKLNRNVTLLRIFPSISCETIRAFLQSPIEGVVLQTYGAGNAPSSRKDIIQELKNATNRGVIIVNITQCPNGKVDPAYETGNALIEAGVIPGSDMTPEACLAKLSYILSKDEWSLEQKRAMVRSNLRGELSVIRERVEDISLVQAIATTLKVSTGQELDSLRNALYPAIVCAIAARGDIGSLMELKKSGIDLCAYDYDLRTPLHIAVNHGHIEAVQYLLSEGSNVHAKDKNGDTPLHLAIKQQNTEIAAVLIKAGALLDMPKSKIGDLVNNAAANSQVTKLQMMRVAGSSLEERDSFGRKCIHALGRFHALDVLVEALDILPVFVLRGNGDVLLFFLSLKDLSISNYIFGPLKMTPAAEDNYGTDACSILCLNCVPPVVVIGTSTGLLYHCIAIEGDSDEELLQQSDDDQSTVYRPEEDAVYAFSTASGLQVAIPESILYVLESIELSFPLTSAENADESLYNVNALNSSLVLLADGRDPKRYLCQHSFGVHIVLVSFLKQLHSAAASLAIREFHDEKSVVEYLVCTRPTIEKGAVLANKNAASSSSFPVGVTLYAFRGFTHIAVLLNSAELICKRLNNVVLPEAVEGGSGLPVKSTTSDISSLLASPGRHSAGNTAAAGKANSNFPQHLEKILQRNSSLPLIKSSAKTKSAAVGQQELEMLITAIDLLRKEYLEKFSLAAKAIEQRKKALRNICQKQFKDIETLKSEKEQILADYIKLMKKYEQTKDAQSLLSARLDKKIAELQYQRPTLSDAEITLKEEMTAEVENIAAYKAKYEQIKRKQRYQEAQLRKVNDGTAAAAMFNGGDADDAAGGRAESAALMPQLNTIKEQLTCQGEEISQLVSLLNRIKCVS